VSTTTSNLGLIKPDVLEDNMYQTISDLASNFQKLDDVSDIYVSEIPTSGDHIKDKKVYFRNVLVGSFIGLVNIRAGKSAPKWRSINEFNVGDEIIPTTDNGHWYTCTQSGYSAPTEPTWLIAAATITEDTNAKTNWQPTKHYDDYDVIVPSTPNGRFYVCTVSGTTGTSEPVWTTTDGIATSDDGVVWMTYRIVKWQESGVAANFRPFGKIE
jgi:hypothetical protein